MEAARAALDPLDQAGTLAEPELTATGETGASRDGKRHS